MEYLKQLLNKMLDEVDWYMNIDYEAKHEKYDPSWMDAEKYNGTVH